MCSLPGKFLENEGFWSSQLLMDLSQVVRRTPRDTPVPLYTGTSPSVHQYFPTAKTDSKKDSSVDKSLCLGAARDLVEFTRWSCLRVGVISTPCPARSRYISPDVQ